LSSAFTTLLAEEGDGDGGRSAGAGAEMREDVRGLKK
jgi:hypothetical protein